MRFVSHEEGGSGLRASNYQVAAGNLAVRSNQKSAGLNRRLGDNQQMCPNCSCKSFRIIAFGKYIWGGGEINCCRPLLLFAQAALFSCAQCTFVGS